MAATDRKDEKSTSPYSELAKALGVVKANASIEDIFNEAAPDKIADYDNLKKLLAIKSDDLIKILPILEKKLASHQPPFSELLSPLYVSFPIKYVRELSQHAINRAGDMKEEQHAQLVSFVILQTGDKEYSNTPTRQLILETLASLPANRIDSVLKPYLLMFTYEDYAKKDFLRQAVNFLSKDSFTIIYKIFYPEAKPDAEDLTEYLKTIARNHPEDLTSTLTAAELARTYAPKENDYFINTYLEEFNQFVTQLQKSKTANTYVKKFIEEYLSITLKHQTMSVVDKEKFLSFLSNAHSALKKVSDEKDVKAGTADQFIYDQIRTSQVFMRLGAEFIIGLPFALIKENFNVLFNTMDAMISSPEKFLSNATYGALITICQDRGKLAIVTELLDFEKFLTILSNNREQRIPFSQVLDDFAKITLPVKLIDKLEKQVMSTDDKKEVDAKQLISKKEIIELATKNINYHTAMLGHEAKSVESIAQCLRMLPVEEMKKVIADKLAEKQDSYGLRPRPDWDEKAMTDIFKHATKILPSEKIVAFAEILQKEFKKMVNQHVKSEESRRKAEGRPSDFPVLPFADGVERVEQSFKRKFYEQVALIDNHPRPENVALLVTPERLAQNFTYTMRIPANPNVSPLKMFTRFIERLERHKNILSEEYIKQFSEFALPNIFKKIANNKDGINSDEFELFLNFVTIAALPKKAEKDAKAGDAKKDVKAEEEKQNQHLPTQLMLVNLIKEHNLTDKSINFIAELPIKNIKDVFEKTKEGATLLLQTLDVLYRQKDPTKYRELLETAFDTHREFMTTVPKPNQIAMLRHAFANMLIPENKNANACFQVIFPMLDKFEKDQMPIVAKTLYALIEKPVDGVKIKALRDAAYSKTGYIAKGAMKPVVDALDVYLRAPAPAATAAATASAANTAVKKNN